MTPLPRFFTASRPKRIPSPTTVKPSSLSLTWGGSTRIPRRVHSSIYSMTLLVLSRMLVRRAAMYSLGWWHLSQAVW